MSSHSRLTGEATPAAPSRFSVVIPSLNSGRFIASALKSALTQEPPPHELIVQDGGSTDETRTVLADFGDRVQWQSEPDHGQADALNRAIARSTGDIVIWLNADDVLLPGAFAAAAEVFKRHPDADFVYGDFELMEADGRVLRRFRSSPYEPDRVFTHGCYIFSGAIFFSRRLLDRVGPFDEKLHACMDFDYLLRIGPARAIHLGTSVARFRMSGLGKSSTMRARFLREAHAIRWRVAGTSIRRRFLTLALDVHDAFALWTQRIRLSRGWSAVRHEKRL